MFSARKTASSLLCLLSKRLENIPAFKENRFPLFLVELEIVLSSDDIQSTTRITDFFVVGKMSGILVRFVILVGP